MIIDAHVHLDLKRYKNVKKAAAQTIKDMDKALIDKAILIPDNYMNLNEHIEEACRLFPGKFYGFGMVNPRESRKKIKEDIDRFAGKKWFRGMKLHPRTQGFTLDERGVSFVLKCRGLYNLPVTIDCLPAFKFTDLDERNFPNAFDRLAKENPATNIIIAHMGGHRLMDAFGVGVSNTNIFLEVSYTFYFYRGSNVENDMAFAMKKLGSKRIIYGSDHPGIGLAEGLAMFGRFCRAHKIDVAGRKDIFGGTISRLIHLQNRDCGMAEKDKREIIKLYEDRLKNYGANIKTMGWRDRPQQKLRFKMLAGVGELDGKSVLDVGCGFGDFYDYLRKNGIKVKYTGFDISPGIIETARRKHPALSFEVKDILKENTPKRYDYVVASGIFNKKISNNRSHAKRMIAKMFDMSKRGIAFNMFTTCVDYKEDILYYYPTEEMIEFTRNLNPFVGLKRNYPLYDFTFYVYKTKNPQNSR
jgi:predicted TIM-barrel fold metal-dependent hydrolase/SAM-dependent methyltransferase